MGFADSSVLLLVLSLDVFDKDDHLPLVSLFVLKDKGLDDLKAVEHPVHARLARLPESKQLRDVLVAQNLLLDPLVGLQAHQQAPESFSLFGGGSFHLL